MEDRCSQLAIFFHIAWNERKTSSQPLNKRLREDTEDLNQGAIISKGSNTTITEETIKFHPDLPAVSLARKIKN